MDNLVRFKLRPHGVWTTNWHADTLLGALANACARQEGPDFLNIFLLEPWLAGDPPFVISDAFPGAALPAPPLPAPRGWPPDRLKEFKKLRQLVAGAVPQGANWRRHFPGRNYGRNSLGVHQNRHSDAQFY